MCVQLIKRFMDRSIPLVPPASLSVVDVRDVARAHIHALTVPGAAQNRHIVTNQCISVKDMATALAKEFKPHGEMRSTPFCHFSLRLLMLLSCRWQRAGNFIDFLFSVKKTAKLSLKLLWHRLMVLVTGPWKGALFRELSHVQYLSSF